MPIRSARIRQDGEELFLTVKEKRQKGAEIDERTEVNVPISNIEAAKNLLGKIGYVLKRNQEKYRTTYKIGDTLVELNQGPKGLPWAEVEGESQEEVRKKRILLKKLKKQSKKKPKKKRLKTLKKRT